MNNSSNNCKLLHLIWVLPFFILVCINTKAQYYDQTIYLNNQSLSKEVLESVDDMAYWLEKSTGSPFEIKTSTSIRNTGIQLQPLEISNLSESIKKKISADGQSFYLSIDGTNKALIVGTGNNSFINGIYTFLQELGFRWYMPGDAWTIVPNLNGRYKNKPGIYSRFSESLLFWYRRR